MPKNSTALTLDAEEHISINDVTISDMVLQGLPYADIAKALGINKMAITRRLSKPITRQIVQTTISALSLYAPKVAKRLMEAINHNDPQISLKGISEYNKIMGLSHAHASVVIQEMYVDQRTQVLSPSLVGLLGSGDPVQSEDDDVIDIDEE